MNLYDFQVTDIHGKERSLEEFKGKVVLVVNTATECGFAYQFKGFQELYERYKDQEFVILGFPSNDFKQETKPREEILKKCTLLYEITFPMFDKVSVKGDTIHPLFDWLTNVKGGFPTKSIKWNFTKFLIDKDGNVFKRFSPRRKPEAIEKHIEEIL